MEILLDTDMTMIKVSYRDHAKWEWAREANISKFGFGTDSRSRLSISTRSAYRGPLGYYTNYAKAVNSGTRTQGFRIRTFDPEGVWE